jgi:hypothetical protein
LRDRRFYLFTTILTSALVFAGFARTFYLSGFFAKMHLPLLFIVQGRGFFQLAGRIFHPIRAGLC